MKNIFNPLQRLHFYAAIFITPLLITLTLSGITYLFFPEVENHLYKHEFYGQSEHKQQQSLNDAIKQIEKDHPGYMINKVSMMEAPYNNRITIGDMDGNSYYIFLDNHNQIVAQQNAKYTYSNMTRSIHSSLSTENTAINYLVELTACWTIFMILSGIYMMFRKRLLTQNSRNLRFQKWHSIVGIIIAVPMLVLVFTGLPWSGFMGDKINKIATAYPALGQTQIAANPPKSEENEIPWAMKKKQAPDSSGGGHHGGMAMPMTHSPGQLSLDKVVADAQKEGLKRPYAIVYPTSADGSFTLSRASNSGVTGFDVSPYKETTMYMDQYTGKKLGQVNYQDYGILAKWLTWGIPLHEGHLFGIANKIINLLVCIAFLGGIIFGFISWFKRLGRMKTPQPLPRRIKRPMSIGLIITLVILGILMPLFGFSLIIVFIIEALLYWKDRRKAKLN